MGEAKRRERLGDESPFLVRSYAVGRRTVTWSFRKPAGGQVHFPVVEWEPDMPKPGELTAGEMGEYRRGRDHIHTELAEKSGIKGRLLILEAAR